jgi:hypothetical protein
VVSNRLGADLSEAAILLVPGGEAGGHEQLDEECFGWPNGFKATGPLSHGGGRHDAITLRVASLTTSLPPPIYPTSGRSLPIRRT